MEGAPVSCQAKTIHPVAPIPTIPKDRIKIPFPGILMSYGKSVLFRMEMLARRR